MVPPPSFRSAPAVSLTCDRAAFSAFFVLFTLVARKRTKQVRLPSNFDFTTINYNGVKELFAVLKVIRSSLHFASLSWNLSSAALVTKVSTEVWLVLGRFLATVSEMVMSSTHFHSSLSGMSNSLIIMMNSHGPSLVP